MATRTRPSDLGVADARRIAPELGREIASARRLASVSQRFVASRAGISPSHLGRLERGELRRPTLDLISRAARAVGLELSVKLYPDGTRLRDAGQLALLDRFVRVPTPPLRTAREVRVPITGDLRAWDLRVTDGSASASVEGEVHLRDIQSVQRRIALKLRDDPRAGVPILLLADTSHNRRVLAEHREALREQFPLEGGAILRSLRAGRIPSAGGIVML
jgi:transcriptional regulator with XRE-family HTH domain